MGGERKYLTIFSAIVLLSVSLDSPPAIANGTQLAIVVGTHSSVSGLSFHELKRLFMGTRIKSPAGRWMLPLNRRKKTAERIGFDDSVLGMSPHMMGSYWVDRKIRGQSGAPKSMKNSRLILQLVGKVPGAIGYVKASEVNARVKVIKIDGKLPGEPGYAIKL